MVNGSVLYCGRIPGALLLGVGLVGWTLYGADMYGSMTELMFSTFPVVVPAALIGLGCGIGWRMVSVERGDRRRVFILSLVIGLVWTTPGAAMYMWAMQKAAEISAST